MSDSIHIIPVDQAQLLLGNSSPDSMSQITEVVTVLSRAFNSFVGYTLREADYADVVVNGSGTGVLILPHLYVTAVSQVQYRQSKTQWTDLDSEYWELDDITHQGVMGYGGYKFAYGARNWRVTFKAGYTLESMPGPIIDAFMSEIGRWLEYRWDLSSKSMSGNANSTTSYLSQDVRRKLHAFMRIGI